MHYPSPEPADFADIHALNAEFIDLARHSGNCPEFAALKDRQLARLAQVPYLLFSLQNDDIALWQRVFSGNTDLADRARPGAPDWAPLAAGTLAFLWSLARRDPHSARLFSGCTRAWCAELANRRLICVTNRMLQAGIRPVSRLHSDSDQWQRLLTDGVCRDSGLRDAAVIGLFQRFNLTNAHDRAFASAACRIPSTIRTQA